jgi:uncharacterized membrane protein YjgN (DUF898 family)
MQGHARQEQHEFQFHGSGLEYFRIWVVNLLLTVLTLGIYSAWAKVRRLQYFYRNTQLAGASFDYHGSPKAILRGRMIGGGLLAVYNTASNLNPLLGLAIGLALSAIMPWLLMRSLRFKLYNTSYRGLRFGFAGQTRGAYDAFLKYPFLAGISAYLLAPLAHQRIKHYQFNNSQFGRTSFSFDASAKSFYWIYLSSVLVMAGAVLLAFAAYKQFVPTDHNLAVLSAGLIPVVAFVVVSALFVAYMQNLIWNSAGLGPHGFYSDVSARRMLWIGATNFIYTLVTLGLYKPFATVRMLRYKLESMGLVASGALAEFVANEQQQVSAAGEETAEMFDADISF